MFFFSRNITSFLYNIHGHIVIRSLPEAPHIHKIVHIQAFKTATGNFVFCILLVIEEEKKICIYTIILFGYTTVTLQKWEPSATQEHANFFFFLFFFVFFFIFVIQINPLGNIFFLLSFHFFFLSASPLIFRWVHLLVPKLELQEMHVRGNIFMFQKIGSIFNFLENYLFLETYGKLNEKWEY